MLGLKMLASNHGGGSRRARVELAVSAASHELWIV